MTGPAGTLITVAPSADHVGHLLRTAIDAEQVGATRLHLPSGLADPYSVVEALREQTTLVITCTDPPADLPVDRVTSGFADVVLEEQPDLPALVADVAALVTAHPDGIAVHGLGNAALPVLLAALAAGGHVWVDPPGDGAPPAGGSSSRGSLTGRPPAVRDHAALVARASGLARIAGRPPLDRRSTLALLGLR